MTVLGEDVAHSGGNLAAYGDAAVTVFHLTAANYEVFGRHGHAPPVVVAAGFDRNAIVARCEHAVFDQDVPT